MSALESFSLDELRRRCAARGHARWAWEGMLPARGLVYVVGPAMSGKTSLALALAAAANSAAQLLGRDVQPGNAVVVSVEHDEAGLADLVEQAEAGACAVFTSDRFQVVRSLLIDDEPQVAALAALCEQVDARIVVIDPMRGVTTRDENNSGDVRDIARALRPLSASRLVLVTHHTGKDGRARGSTDIVAQSDGMLYVGEPNAKGEQTIDARPRAHGAPVKLRVRKEHEDGAMRFVLVDGVDAPGCERADKLRERVAACVAANPGCTTSTVRKNVGAKNADVAEALTPLCDAGTIENRGVSRASAWHPA